MKLESEKSWSRIDPRTVSPEVEWTPCEVVVKWFESNPTSRRLALELEANAMKAMIEQTRWNGTGQRFCTTVQDDGVQKILFAVVQENGQTHAIKLDCLCGEGIAATAAAH